MGCSCVGFRFTDRRPAEAPLETATDFLPQRSGTGVTVDVLHALRSDHTAHAAMTVTVVGALCPPGPEPQQAHEIVNTPFYTNVPFRT